jgi:hypothetical protein
VKGINSIRVVKSVPPKKWDAKADPYGKQNLQTKTKVAASFVFTSPYVGNFHHKTCCKFCGTGLLP